MLICWKAFFLPSNRSYWDDDHQRHWKVCLNGVEVKNSSGSRHLFICTKLLFLVVVVVVETSIISSWGSLRKRSILFSQSSSKNTIRLKVCPMICLHKLILLRWLFRWKIELILNYCNADGWRRWWWCLSFCLPAWS